jgi:ribonuclease BN (tRNA processing enzyme)
MDLYFLGVGEACDFRQPNTSILLKPDKYGRSGRILLDCGFTVPHLYFSLHPDPDGLESLWISHFHGDHFFGTPLLLLWFWEMERQKPFRIVGPPGIENKIRQLMELAYPNLLSRLDFSLIFNELTENKPLEIADTLWQAAYDEHSQPCLSLRLELQNKAIFYSGDGRPTPATQILAQGCDIIIHEAYGFKDTTPGHGSISTCLDFSRRAGVKQLALLHLQRDLRLKVETSIKELMHKYPDLNILLPEKGTTLTL